jgi:hypothetical protein
MSICSEVIVWYVNFLPLEPMNIPMTEPQGYSMVKRQNVSKDFSQLNEEQLMKSYVTFNLFFAMVRNTITILK